jgi:4-hydroxy-tetrahydrodipicolinate reductase
MTERVRVIQYGLGPIGSAIARHVTERDGLALVGAVDVDPEKAGREAGGVIGLGRPLGFPVTSTLGETLARAQADVVLHTTSSYFDRFKPQILEILAAGLDIVSTAEELSFPWLAHPEEAAEVDAAARRMGTTVLGTGVNPGFVMDSLPLFLTAICQRVDRIEVRRAMNASLRRGPFQAKIGAGLTVEAFNARMAAGRMGHVGLPESVGMVFHTLGKTLARYESEVEPVVAERRIVTEFFDVAPGHVAGLKQTARAFASGGEFLTLTFLAALDADEDRDTIKIDGVPSLEVTLKGTNGDLATVAIAVNAIKRVREAAPGLATMCDLSLVAAWAKH